MADSQAFSASAGFSVSNFAVLVGGAIVGGVIAWKFFKNGDVNLKTERALTNQNYIEDEIYRTMRASAAYPATINENKDRILSVIRRYKIDVRNLIDKLRRKEITPAQFRASLHALAQEINSQLGVGQLGEAARAERKVECEQRIQGVINRLSGSKLTQIQKDKLVAQLSARKARC